MIKKVFISVIIYLFIIVFSNCERCGGSIPYFDFQSVSFDFENGPELQLGEKLLFRLNEEDVTYLTTLNNTGNAAYADCIDDGDFGMKFPVEKVIFILENDLNSQYKKGDTITQLIQQEEYNPQSEQYEFYAVDTVTYWNYLYQSLRLNITPDSAQSNQLKVVLKKSNGEIVEGVSEMFFWK